MSSSLSASDRTGVFLLRTDSTWTGLKLEIIRPVLQGGGEGDRELLLDASRLGGDGDLEEELEEGSSLMGGKNGGGGGNI